MAARTILSPMLAAALTATALAACGGGASHAASKPPSPTGISAPASPASAPSGASLGDAGAQVLAILNTAKAALNRDKAGPNDAATYRTLAADYSKASAALRNVTYPPSAQVDATALAAAVDKLGADSTELANVDWNDSAAALIEVPAMVGNITSDEGTELAASNALRHDLGLPPATL